MKRNIIDNLKERPQGFSWDTPYKLMYRGFPHHEDVKLHYHDNLELNLYHGIKGQVYLNGREYSLADHSLLILPPRTLHSYLIPAQEGQMVILQISFTHLNRYMNINELAHSLGILWERVPYFTADSDIPRLCYKLMEESNLSLPDFLIWVIELLKSLSKLQRDRLKDSDNPNLNTAVKVEWLRKVISHTEREYHRKLSLDEVAGIIGYSPAYFSRLFKKSTGLNYKDYLLTVRLNRSDELLKEGLSVSEASELCGFQDVSYFIKVFRENRGISPGRHHRSSVEGASLG